MKTEKCWCDICGNEIIADQIFNSADWSRFDILNFSNWIIDAFKELKQLKQAELSIIPRNKYHACEECKKDIVKIDEDLKKIYYDRLAFVQDMLKQKATEKTAKLFKDIKND